MTLSEINENLMYVTPKARTFPDKNIYENKNACFVKRKIISLS